METLDTQLLVDRLTKRMDLHRIFLFSYPLLAEEQLHLLLIVNPIKGLSPDSMAPIVSLCMSEVGELPFDMMLAGEWQNQLKKGNLYYTYASLPQHQLFAESKKRNTVLANKTIRGLLEVARLNYEKCRKSSDEFKDAVNSYLDKGDYSQATFMLHQFLVLRLKGFQATVGMNRGKSQNVEHLMKSLKGITPTLLSIFPYDGGSIELYRLLDQSYTKGKKMESIEITEEEFYVLLEKSEEAGVALDSMVAAMVERITAYQEQHPDGDAEEQKKIEPSVKTIAKAAPESLQVRCEDFSKFPWPEQYKQDVNTLLDGIYQKHRPEQVIMLNYHTGGFSGGNLFQQTDEDSTFDSKVELYLIVLMKNIGPYRFKCCKQGTASAMVVYLHVNEVERKLAEGDRFVHTWWTKGWVLRKKSTFSPTFSENEVDWKGEYERVKAVWRNARITLENMCKLIEKSDALSCDLGLMLLSNMLQVGLNTYLKCAVGFVPSKLSLLELFTWSGITGRQVINRLSSNAEEHMRLLQISLNPKQIWWQNQALNEDMNSWYFVDKTREYFKLFDECCSETLSELERKVQKSENFTSKSIG